jgi:rod shape-determining protein MreD
MKIKDFILYFAVITLHWWFDNNLTFFKIGLNFAFISLIIINITLSPLKALFFSFFIAIFVDLYSWTNFGLHCLLYSLISYFIFKIKKNIDSNSLFSRNLVFLFYYILFLMLYSLIYYLINKYSPFKWYIYFISPIVNLIAFEFFFNLFVKLYGDKKCL